MDLFYKPVVLFYFITHKIAFACSPIDKLRLEEELKKADTEFRKKEESGSVLEDETDDEDDDDYWNIDNTDLSNKIFSIDWLWIFCHLSEVIKLIEEYHMVDRRYIYLFIVQIIYNTHMLVKILYYTLQNRNEIDLPNSELLVYYPNVSGSFKNSILFNNLLVPIMFLNLVVRLRALYCVIRYSLINKNRYQHFTISQVNIYSFTCFTDLTIADWIGFIIGSIKHDEEVKRNPRLRWAHKNAMLSNQIMSSTNFTGHQSNFKKIYYFTMMNFAECYFSPQINLNHKFERPARLEYNRWHPECPNFRLDIGIERKLAAVNVAAVFGMLFSGVACSAGFVYMELGSILLSGGINDTESSQITSKHFLILLSHPMHLIRLVELLLNLILLVPYYYLVAFVITDLSVVTSRINRLVELLTDDLERGRISLGRQYSYHRLFTPDPRELNERLEHNLELVKLVYMEFLDLRNAHTTYLNWTLIGNGLGVSYALSLIFELKSTSEYAIVLIAITATVVPNVAAIIICADIESNFKRVYSVLLRLLVNEFKLIKRKNVVSIMKLTTQLCRVEDRSFVVGASYALTPDSIVPFLTYVATVILFINRIREQKDVVQF